MVKVSSKLFSEDDNSLKKSDPDQIIQDLFSTNAQLLIDTKV